MSFTVTMPGRGPSPHVNSCHSCAKVTFAPMKGGPIVLVDDDVDDIEIIREALKDIGIENEVRFFERCLSAFEYLKSTRESPLIIFCDVNIPEQTGLEFKKQIDEDSQLRSKSIPFVFFSTSVDQASVNKAYREMTVQGFFQKQNNYKSLKKELNVILEYWQRCQHPNT